jgi:GT2 family glycosyltransferase
MVSIIIVNYNTFQLTTECIHSVIQFTVSTPYEIILVDNASTECDASKFLEEFPQITLIKSDKNGGFAYGNNLGIEKAKGQYILLLNSDCILKEDSISKSLDFMKDQPDIGVLGCRLVFPDGKVQYSVRKFKSIKWELFNIFRFIPYALSYKKRAKLMLGKYFRYDQNIGCDWIGGAFFLMPRVVIEKLPGQKLDDRFFMYGEDQLWCMQIKELGYRIVFFAGTTVVHIHSGSTKVSKQIGTRKLMAKHELEIMKIRKGKGFYYYCYKTIFLITETVTNWIKSLYFLFTKKQHY